MSLGRQDKLLGFDDINKNLQNAKLKIASGVSFKPHSNIHVHKVDVQQGNSKGFVSNSTDSSVSFKEGESTSLAVSNSSVSVSPPLPRPYDYCFLSEFGMDRAIDNSVEIIQTSYHETETVGLAEVESISKSMPEP